MFFHWKVNIVIKSTPSWRVLFRFYAIKLIEIIDMSLVATLDSDNVFLRPYSCTFSQMKLCPISLYCTNYSIWQRY